jgi:tRNA-dihydrouridine synthase 3
MDERARQELFRGKVILAPMTKGGNLPFRQLAVELGAEVTMGEMAMADKVVRRARGELALLRRAPQEGCFGAQLAGRRPEELAQAAHIAQERGASFVDLNLGCPIDLFCRRGIGAALLERPAKVGTLVAAIRRAVDIPVTVKLRTGYDEERPRYLEVARAAQEAGADAVTLHGRSRTQRYRRAADWNLVGELTAALSIPVIGNGDLLTWREVEQRWRSTGCASVMIARGALIKPWIFREIRERRDLLLSPAERADLLRRWVALALLHFGADEHGRTRVRDFLCFHLDFFNRYRPVESEAVTPDDHPLIQTRADSRPPADGWHALLYRTDPEAIAELADRLMGETPRADCAQESPAARAPTDEAILAVTARAATAAAPDHPTAPAPPAAAPTS